MVAVLDDLKISCPHCGHEFDPRDVQERRHLIMMHPTVCALREETRLFLEECPLEFLMGVQVGVVFISSKTTYTKSAVYKQMHRLIGAGLVEARLIKNNGRNCRYRFVLYNDTGNK